MEEENETQIKEEISDIDYFDIRENYEKMTEVQWKEYSNGLIGKVIKWTGYIDDIKEDGKVWIDMDPPEETLSLQDVYINIPKADILNYNKDQKITFQGIIEEISIILSKPIIDIIDIKIVNE